MIYYKVLNEDGTPCNGGNGTWDTSGGWMPKLEKKLRPCKYGYHLCRKRDLVCWLGPAIWTVEVRGQIVRDGNKCVCREARLVERLSTWNERSTRLFACDCAEHALRRIVKPDQRSIDAIAIARRFANGKATEAELAAARDAAGAAARDAWAAAWAAAGAAARDAEHNWQTARLFHYLNEGAGS